MSPQKKNINQVEVEKMHDVVSLRPLACKVRSLLLDSVIKTTLGEVVARTVLARCAMSFADAWGTASRYYWHFIALLVLVHCCATVLLSLRVLSIDNIIPP